ncbi:TetR/AcrR family transcriptional regulator [Thalassovita sp.]|uniref:TetR/AcrR family transcriptional regulator n=1 Tax=Thalassovita sp. TaxID=1979401 RepID=UPI002AAF1500|nr:TetR family transcriptional regulator C-terminal domain-containing protein [Thalassovita sp.]
MQEKRRKFKRQSAEERKQALVQATLDLVAEQGVQAATVRAISERAEVTQGLIRHYFSTKEELILAAYEYHMNALTDQASAAAEAEHDSARGKLAGFIRASLKPPVVDPRALALWAGFMTMLLQDPAMRQIHERSYVYFRNRLQALIAEALTEAGKTVSEPRLRGLAIACNAVVDGLWLEGGALPEAFGDDELPKIGLEAVGAIIDLSLDLG